MKPILKLFFGLLFTLCPYTIVADNKKPDLIDSACDHTLYKDLCKAILHKDPESRAANDRHVLARVSLKYALSRGKQIQNQITKLQDKSAALKDCSENYQDATKQLRDSFNALKSNRYNDANTWVTAAMSDADSCEEGFKGQGRNFPISRLSNTFSQLCSNVLALTNLLKGQ